MARLQCPHWALVAPAPQLSSPSVHHANVQCVMGVRRTEVHPLTLPPLATLALRALQGQAYIPVRGHSLPVLL